MTDDEVLTLKSKSKKGRPPLKHLGECDCDFGRVWSQVFLGMFVSCPSCHLGWDKAVGRWKDG